MLSVSVIICSVHRPLLNVSSSTPRVRLAETSTGTSSVRVEKSQKTPTSHERGGRERAGLGWLAALLPGSAAHFVM